MGCIIPSLLLLRFGIQKILAAKNKLGKNSKTWDQLFFFLNWLNFKCRTTETFMKLMPIESNLLSFEIYTEHKIKNRHICQKYKKKAQEAVIFSWATPL